MGAGLGVIRALAEKAAVREAEWWLGDPALAALVAAPAFLGLFAYLGRPVLFLPAGVTAVVLSVTFLSGAGLPLLVPGVMFLVCYFRPQPRARATVPAVAVPIILVAASFAVLLIGSYRVVCWREIHYGDGRVELSRDLEAERDSRPGVFSGSGGPPRPGVVADEGGCTEGAVDPARAAGSLGLTAAAVAAGWVMAPSSEPGSV